MRTGAAQIRATSILSHAARDAIRMSQSPGCSRKSRWAVKLRDREPYNWHSNRML